MRSRGRNRGSSHSYSRRVVVEQQEQHTQYPRLNNRLGSALIPRQHQVRLLLEYEFNCVSEVRDKLVKDLIDYLRTVPTSTKAFSAGFGLVGATGEEGLKFGYKREEYAGVNASNSRACFVLEQALLDQLEDLVGDNRIQWLLLVKKWALELIPSGYAIPYGTKSTCIEALQQTQSSLGRTFMVPATQLSHSEDELFNQLEGFYKLSAHKLAALSKDGSRPIEDTRDALKKFKDNMQGVKRIAQAVSQIRFSEDAYIVLGVNPEIESFDLIGRSRRLGDEPHISVRRAFEGYYGGELPIQGHLCVRLSSTAVGFPFNMSFFELEDAVVNQEALTILDYKVKSRKPTAEAAAPAHH